jgi:hypothetical protein
MRKAVTALAALATLATAAVATPTTADAGRGWWGPAIVGGLAAGAIVGSALARPYPYYGSGYGYYPPAPVYYDYYTPGRPIIPIMDRGLTIRAGGGAIGLADLPEPSSRANIRADCRGEATPSLQRRVAREQVP